MCLDVLWCFVNASSAAVIQDSCGSARTDYRAIQLAKKKKQRGPSASSSSEQPPRPPVLHLLLLVSNCDCDAVGLRRYRVQSQEM